MSGAEEYKKLLAKKGGIRVVLKSIRSYWQRKGGIRVVLKSIRSYWQRKGGIRLVLKSIRSYWQRKGGGYKSGAEEYKKLLAKEGWNEWC